MTHKSYLMKFFETKKAWNNMKNITDMKFYSTEVALKVGIIPAVIHTHICFWIKKNKANDRHFINGKYWTYNSASGFAKYFPELTERQIKYALQKLLDAKLIEKGRFNKTGYDKTNWYTIPNFQDDAPLTPPNSEDKIVPSLDKNEPSSDNFVLPIPDIKQQSNTQSVKKENIKKKESLELPLGGMETSPEAEEKSKTKSELDEQAAKIYELYPRKAARPDAIKAIKKALKVEGYTDLYAKTQKYATAVKESQKEMLYIPYPATWFNREEYNDDWSGLYQTSPRGRRPRAGINEQHYDRTPYINPDDPDDIPF